jgi:recombination DNA repair RAD52 pathway protein
MIFTDQQMAQLLRGIHPGRVKTTQGNSYLEQHDVRAHLNRVFGFGNWDQAVTRLDMVFEQPTVIIPKGQDKPIPNRWDACWTASVKLTVRGAVVISEFPGYCEYEDAATGIAQNQTRGEAHDLAVKSAVSTALKRAATSLGDQFGLSLYSGTVNPIVRGVIGWAKPEKEADKEAAAAIAGAFANLNLDITKRLQETEVGWDRR